MTTITEFAQGVVKGFVEDYWGGGNFSPAIVSSTGFILATKSVAGALAYVGSPNVRTICDLKISDLYKGIEARRGFRETFLASFAVTAWNVSEISFYFFMGAVSFVFTNSTNFFNLTRRSIVQLVANSFYGFVGFVGQFSPTIAAKIYAVALVQLFKLVPDLIGICKNEFSRDLEGLSNGILIALGMGTETPASRTSVNEALAQLSEAAGGLEAQLVCAATEIARA